MPKQYLAYLTQVHKNFRRAELESLAQMNNLDIDFSTYSEDTPFFIVTLDNDEQAKAWFKRVILGRAIYELWGHADSYAELHESIKSNPNYEQMCQENSHKTFKFEFDTYRGSTTDAPERAAIIESFKYLDFKGKVRMKNPENVFTVVEEYRPVNDAVAGEKVEHVYFGRLVQESSRQWADKLDLKKRPYKGTTSFEAELSLVTCNIAQVAPGKIMYDPFAGTGSFLVAGGHWGALVVGSDIDGRMIRGKGNNTIKANFQFYDMSLQFLDVLTMDFTHNSLRGDLCIDSIVCDPPYGIRESIKVLGARDPTKFEGKELVEKDGMPAYLHKDYIPTKKPYELDSLLDDLLQYSVARLPVGGRLAFWMPTANEDDSETIIPLHSDMELLYDCVQEFNKWSRRLLVYVHRGEGFNGPNNVGLNRTRNFRERYFNAFNK